MSLDTQTDSQADKNLVCVALPVILHLLPTDGQVVLPSLGTQEVPLSPNNYLGPENKPDKQTGTCLCVAVYVSVYVNARLQEHHRCTDRSRQVETRKLKITDTTAFSIHMPDR